MCGARLASASSSSGHRTSAETIGWGHITEGFYDTALNEASESELRKLYQCHGPLPKSQGVPEGPLRKNHVSRRLTLSDLASKVGKIAIGQILVANKDVHWVGIIDIQVHLEIGIETEQKTPFINM